MDQHLFYSSLEKNWKNNVQLNLSLPVGGELLNPNQSGFLPSDSCINQLLAIIHKTFEAFDCNPPHQVNQFFLDKSKHL